MYYPCAFQARSTEVVLASPLTVKAVVKPNEQRFSFIGDNSILGGYFAKSIRNYYIGLFS
jgi:hypothetical protein